MDTKPLIWLVIPCFNEEEVLPRTAPMFLRELEGLVESGKISANSRICFVDDGSTDGTWGVIRELSAKDSRFQGVALSRNRGHQNALLCGLMEARGHCDAAISLDCDGQDDIHAISEMVDNFLSGDDIVYGVRDDRATDSALKRGTAGMFYRLMDALGAETIRDHADYRLMSERALDALAEFDEVNLYLRGMVPQIGLPHSVVYYRRDERAAGESHYTLGKMLSLALSGITSFSVRPIRIVSGLGIAFSLIGLVGVIWALVSALFGQVVAGWTSTVVIVCLIGGIQLLSIGVVGEYVGKIYLEAKRRPRYQVMRRTWEPAERRYRG